VNWRGKEPALKGGWGERSFRAALLALARMAQMRGVGGVKGK